MIAAELIHIRRARCPVNPKQKGWAYVVIAANGQSARGWHDGTRDDAERAARKTLRRMERLSRSPRWNGTYLVSGRSAEQALLRPEVNA